MTVRDLLRPWTCRGGFGPFGLFFQMLVVATLLGLAAAAVAWLAR